MTEGEWLACRDSAPLIEFLRGPRIVCSEVLHGCPIEVFRRRDEAANARKMRLFACACCRRIEHLVSPARFERLIGGQWASRLDLNSCSRALEWSECYADRNVGSAESGFHRDTFNAVINTLCAEAESRRSDPQQVWEYDATIQGAMTVRDTCEREFFRLVRVVAESRAVIARFRNRAPTTTRDANPDAEETVVQIALLRDIFGNPFRPVDFSPAWRTDTAVSLAHQMYEPRDFSTMPILADALQDAGCDNADILDHCRSPGPHVRGCWVVDLVLGKE